jgi:hypothetical protein
MLCDSATENDRSVPGRDTRPRYESETGVTVMSGRSEVLLSRKVTFCWNAR